MIQANELRIGNYLSLQSDMYAVTGFDIDCAEDEAKIFNEEYSPIPLTPEILFKCGFTTYKNFFVLDEDIIINYDVSFWWSNLWQYDKEFGYDTIVPYRKIEYLHQLQNLYFALTNKELSIFL